MLLLYSLRTLFVQRRVVLPAMLAVFIVIAVVSSLTLLVDNVESTVIDSGRADTALILARDATRMQRSSIQTPDVARLRLLPGIAKDDDEILASAELITNVRVKHQRDRGFDTIALRGVDPVVLKIDPRVSIVSGPPLAAGTAGIWIGQQLMKAGNGIKVGTMIRLARHSWPVVGVFAAPGTLYESEMWCDRTALVAERQLSRVNSVLAKVAPADMEQLRKGVANIEQPRLTVISDLDMNRLRTAELKSYVDLVWLLTAVLMTGGVLACVSTMYALYIRRVKEFGTLMAIGFTRRQVSLMLMFESFLIVGVSAIAGMLVMACLFGRSMPFADMNLIVHLRPSRAAERNALLVALCVTAASTAVAMIQLRKLVVLEVLNAH